MKIKAIGLSAVLLATMATAQQQVGNTTNVSSPISGLISERFQKHSWFTSDGVLHMLLRVPQLTLYSSDPTYTTFTAEFVLGASSQTSTTSDGILIGDILYLVYSDSSGNIDFAILNYSAVTKLWTAGQSSVVVTGPNNVRPSIAIDDAGAYWVGCVNETSTLDTFQVFTGTDGLHWTAKAAKLPGASATQLRSLRMLNVQGAGLAAIYSNNNVWGISLKPNGSSWVNEGPFFKRVNPVQNDPHCEHFSCHSDGAGNIHFLSGDGNYSGVYYRYNVPALTLFGPLTFSGTQSTIRAAYMEVAGDTGGNLFAVFSATVPANPSGILNCLSSWKSADNGNTWTEGVVLVPPYPQTNEARPEIPEMPEGLRYPFPAFQQVAQAFLPQSLISYLVQ